MRLKPRLNVWWPNPPLAPKVVSQYLYFCPMFVFQKFTPKFNWNRWYSPDAESESIDVNMSVQQQSLLIKLCGRDLSTVPFTFVDRRHVIWTCWRSGLEIKCIIFHRIQKSNGQKVFYLQPDRFVLESSAQPFLLIPNNDWSLCSSRFEVLAALYRLSILPSHPSHRRFSHRTNFLMTSAKLFVRPMKYPLPLKWLWHQSLHDLQPCDWSRKFAFGDIEFAITKFNRQAFPDIQADRLTHDGYYHLRNLVEFVRAARSSMDLIPDMRFYNTGRSRVPKGFDR
jgi:hypothetical protein